MIDILLKLQEEYKKSLNHKTTYAVGYGTGLLFAIEQITKHLNQPPTN
jgi:hypothetical protein